MVDSPDVPEPHPGDPWHPAWTPDAEGEAATEDALAAEAVARIEDHVARLDTDEQVREATERTAADQRRLSQVDAARRSGPSFDTTPPGSDADVTPIVDAPVAESGSVSSRGWLRRRRRRPQPVDPVDIAPVEEEEPQAVDDVDRENDEERDIVEDPADDGAGEEWAATLEDAAAETGDEDVYAALSEEPTEDEFPWDDEDWSAATSGDDVPVTAELDLVTEESAEHPPAEAEAAVEESVQTLDDAEPDDAESEDLVEVVAIEDEDPVQDEPADEVAADIEVAAVEPGEDLAPGIDDDVVELQPADEDVVALADDDSEDAMEAAEEAEAADDAGDEPGRFSHAEVIPLVRPRSLEDEDVSAGLDPDLVAVAEEEADSGETIEDIEPETEAADADVPDADPSDAADEDAYAAFTLEDYTGTATEEYAELARAVAASEEADHEMAAVSAEMPGLDTSLVSLDDVVDAGISVTETISTTRRSDLGLRVATGLGLLAVFLGSLLWPWAIGGLILVVLSVAALELYIVCVQKGYRPLTWAGLIGVVGALAGTWVWGVVAIPIALGLTMIGATLFLALSAERRTPLLDISLTVAAMAWIGVLGAPAFEIVEAPDYQWLILAIVLTTAIMDVAQYFVGRWLGRRPLASVVSPKKTIEGLVGGVFAALIVGVALGSFEASPFDPGSGLAFGAMVAVVAPLGDLAVSVVKRTLDVKDMGAILPGHGGVLDRIDAMIFVIPSAWILYRFFDLLG